MIPVFEPTLFGNEKKYVMDCLDTNWISSSGKYVKEFEEKFAQYCDSKYGISTTNGTTALHLALETLRISKGDEVILPSFTMIACANSIAYTGATPILVDSDPLTWNIDVNKIEEKITDKTKAIMPVHIYGHPCDMNKIMKIANDHNLFVIEDASEAHGALFDNKKAGSFGHINAFSFYANKVITTGEGGMVVTKNEKLAERARKLKNHFFDDSRTFLHKEIGYNYRMTNIQAAIGLAQLENIDSIISKKIELANKYDSLLREVPGIILPPKSDSVKNIYWMYGIVLDDNFGISRDQLKDYLKEKGVDTRVFFTGIHKQPQFLDNNQYPIADKLGNNGLYLPSSLKLTDEQLNYVVNCIKEARNGK